VCFVNAMTSASARKSTWDLPAVGLAAPLLAVLSEAEGSASAKFLGPCARAVEYSLGHLLHDQAVFFAERLVAELPGSDEALRLLATAHLRAGDAGRAYTLLKERASSDARLRYLFADCCHRLERLDEAEQALLPPTACRQPATSSTALPVGAKGMLPLYAFGFQDGSDDAIPTDSGGQAELVGVAGGASGLFLLGQIRERLRRPTADVTKCYRRCLDLCPFMWCAYERLSWLSHSSSATPCSASIGNPDRRRKPGLGRILRGAMSARVFAETHFSEESISRNRVLNPVPTPARATASTATAVEDPSLSETAGQVVPPKRRRLTEMSAVEFSPLPACTRASSSFHSPERDKKGSPGDRVPLADRSAASLPSPPPPQQPPSPEFQGSPVQTPTLWARFSPRRLLPSPFAMPCLQVGRCINNKLTVQSSPPLHSKMHAEESDTQNSATDSEAHTLASLAEDIASGRKPAIVERAKSLTLANVLQKMGEAVHALHAFDCKEALQALRSLPPRQRDTGLVQNLVARCHFEMGEYREAVQIYSQACRGNNLDRPLGLEYYSTALWHLQDALELGNLAKRVLDWNRQQPQAWCVVGNSFSMQQEHEQAIRCFRRAIQLDPSFVYAYTLMAHELAASEKFDKALQMYERAVEIDARHYNAWWGLGNVFNRQEEYQKARYHFEKATEINGSNAVLQISLGTVLKAMGQTEQALDLFTRAARTQQCKALALFHRGSALIVLGRHSEAAEELKRAQLLAPREAGVQLELGRAYAGKADTQRALLHFNMALDLCGSRDSQEYHVIVAAQNDLLRTTPGL